MLELAIAYTLAAMDLKEAIAKEQSLITQESSTSRSEHKKNLAILLYKDQNPEKAFEVFLEALNEEKTKSEPPVSEEEKRLYDEALKLYLDQNGEKLSSVATTVCKKYGSSIALHPEYHQLGFILAASYANLERFPEYFERFYQSYQFFPKHYLAYKGKASLHAQLFARRRTLADRRQQQELIIQNLENAINQFPADTSLYKLTIVFAPDDQKKVLINRYLNKIIDENIIIPRIEIVFYVHHALAVSETHLAQRFVNKAREWYPNSRALDAAQLYIEEKNNG